MSPTIVTFLFETANFVVLAGVLGWLFFHPVRQAIENRRAQLTTEAQRAQELLDEAEMRHREIDAAQSNLREEMESFRKQEIAAVRRQADQILATAQAAAKRERVLGRHQAARITDSQRETLAEVAVRVAARAVGQLLTDIGASSELHEALVRSACAQLQPTDAESSSFRVEVARPLTNTQRTELQSRLKNQGQSLRVESNESLGAGMRIWTNRGMIDATVSGLTQFAKHALGEELEQRLDHRESLQATRDG